MLQIAGIIIAAVLVATSTISAAVNIVAFHTGDGIVVIVDAEIVEIAAVVVTVDVDDAENACNEGEEETDREDYSERCGFDEGLVGVCVHIMVYFIRIYISITNIIVEIDHEWNYQMVKIYSSI